MKELSIEEMKAIKEALVYSFNHSPIDLFSAHAVEWLKVGVDLDEAIKDAEFEKERNNNLPFPS